MDRKPLVAATLLTLLSLSATYNHPRMLETRLVAKQQNDIDLDSRPLERFLEQEENGGNGNDDEEREERGVDVFGNLMRRYRRQRRQLLDQLLDGNGGRFCGKSLGRVVELVCNSNYYSFDKKKPEAAVTELAAWRSTESSSPSFPFRNKKQSKVLFPQFSGMRGSRGITDECCHKSCTYSEVSTYCGT